MSAIFLAMYTRSILPSSHGNFYELYAIADFAVSGSVILIGVLADQEYADSRERRERLRRLAAGGAAAPAEPAIHAYDRIASSASMELSAAKDLQIPCMNGRAGIIVADPFN
jgi:hypothetical protein